jgi:hypothetical protein
VCVHVCGMHACEREREREKEREREIARALHVLHHRKSLGFCRIKVQALKRSQISHLSLRLLLMHALGSAPQTFD